MSIHPLIAICGTTGVGKSKLAIELALKLAQGQINGWQGARIINADSMQIYNGMDIITNKVPEANRQGVEHLLMGIREPGDQYVVGQWVQDAVKVIEETHLRNQVPIVVGGTSYWIQNLIFPNRLVSFESYTPSSELAKSVSSLSPPLRVLLDSLPVRAPLASTDSDAALALHQLLSALDPKMAVRWHWRDTRKVLRSLSIMKETGRRMSEILNEQSEVAGQPRYRTLCFWLYAEPSVLQYRLDQRVDEMIEQGLIDEIRTLREIAAPSWPLSRPISTQVGDISSELDHTDYSVGIYQSIGYKEFHDYLTSPDPSESKFNDAVVHMKHSTRKYAKRQISWLRNKLLPAIYEANTKETLAHMYLLDTTGDKWGPQVRDIAESITQDFLQEKGLPDPLSISAAARGMLNVKLKHTSPNSVIDARRKIICPICTIDEDKPVMIEEYGEWDAHQKNRLHRRLASKRRRDQGNQIEEGKRIDDVDNCSTIDGTQTENRHDDP